MASNDPAIAFMPDASDLWFFEGGGAITTALHAIDWDAHPLGAPRDWPAGLKSSVNLCLRSAFPTTVYWGAELWMFCNEAWLESADNDTLPIGRAAANVRHEAWALLAPMFANTLATGERLSLDAQRAILQRDGVATETFWSYSSTPIVDENGMTRGLFNQGCEVTAHVLAERALRAAKQQREFVLTLVEEHRLLGDPDDVMQLSAQAVARHLGADRVGFLEVSAAGRVEYGACWVKGPLPPKTGSIPVSALSPQMLAISESGVTFNFNAPDDVRLLDSGLIALIDAKSGVGVPLVRGGSWQGGFYVDHAEPRVWTRDEIALIEEVAELSWDAVARVRAVARLRAMNANLTGEVAERTAERDKLWDVSNDLLGIATKDGRWLTVNPAWERLLGWSEAEIVGRDSQWLRHPGDTGGSAAEIARIAASGTTHRLEKRLRTRDGEYRTFAWQTTLFGDRLYANARDITEERRHEAASAAADARTRMALDAMEGVGVWTYDIVQDRFDIDLGYTKLYGFEPADFPHGISPSDMGSRIHPDDRPALAAALERSKTLGENAAHEYRLLMPDGSQRWVMARNVVQRDEAGQPVKIVGVGIDITRQREIHTRFSFGG